MAGPFARAQDAVPTLCPPPLLAAGDPPPEETVTRFHADFLDATGDGIYRLRGNVEGTAQGRRLSADLVTYDENSREATAEGQLRYRDDSLLVEAAGGRVELETDRGELEQADYRLLRGQGRGSAGRAELLGDRETRLQRVTYTTCPPDSEDWVLSARRVEMDHEEGSGTARDVVLRFKDVPIIWLPWASFPLDERRKTGFLVPTIGSGEDGLDLTVPYYINIAPNYDATLSPRLITERGVMIGGEFRYLEPRHTGVLRFEYLPDDDLANDNRGLVQFNNASALTSQWRFDLNYNRVSDEEYFEDFGDSLNVAATTFLHSRAALHGGGRWWEATLEADDYQVLADFRNPDREPYQRLPRFWIDARRPLGDSPVYASLGAEAVVFDRDTGVTGTRVDLYPAIGARFAGSAGHLEPRIGVRYTGYDLDNTTGPTSPDRTLPMASLDGGLVFERRWGGDLLQTLEPRFYYLYVPFEDQSDLPVFDTTPLDFEHGQLFRDNRFSSADRFGDANQLTLAVTSRWIDPASGRNPLSVTVGQIAYFDDLEVQLPGNPVVDRDTSPVITEIEYSPLKSWSAVLGMHLDLEEDETDKSVFALRYRPENSTGVFNLSYRFRRGRLEVADASGIWPVSDQWRLMARWYYDIDGGRTLESLAGVEYESCCWALRLVGRHYVHNRRGDTRDGIYLQFELKGLGTLGGSRAATVLERGILGYSDFGYEQ